MKSGYIVALVAVVCATRVNHIGGTCYPSSVLQDFNRCFSGYNRVFDLKSGMFNAAKVKEYCTTDSASEVQCAENLLNDCKDLSSQTREALDKSVSVNAFKTAVGIICSDNSTSALEAAEGCLNRYGPGVTSCIQEKYSSDMSQILSTTDMEDRYQAMCDLHGDITRCQAPFGDNCGREVQTLFDAVSQASMPPICSAVSTSVSLALLGAALVFLTLTKKF